MNDCKPNRSSPLLLAVLGLGMTVASTATADKLPKPDAAAAAPTAVDNSAINRRDRMSQTLTPPNQSDAPEDIELVAALRRSVLDTPGLSVDGQNIKIIAHMRLVTLRGPVRDYEERMSIERAVRRVVGDGAIDNQLQPN